jgi:putative transposase
MTDIITLLSCQRFFNTALCWCRFNWVFIRHRLVDKDDVILLAGDETTVTKSGKLTYGLDRFFSSIFGKPVRGIAFLCLSLISVKHRKS